MCVLSDLTDYPSLVEGESHGILLQHTKPRGRVNDLSFFDYSSPFCFLLIEFHCIFSLSCKVIPFYVYSYYILIR